MGLDEEEEDLMPTTFYELLLKCPISEFEELFHHLVDVFCGQNGSLFNTYSDVYKIFEWWKLKEESVKFFKEYFSEDNVISEEKCGSLASEYAETVKDILDVRAEDLKTALIEKSHEVAPAYLKSFDWKVKATLASDKMSQINEPRLILDLEIAGNKDKSLQLDLSKEEVRKLLDEMETAKFTVWDFMAEGRT